MDDINLKQLGGATQLRLGQQKDTKQQGFGNVKALMKTLSFLKAMSSLLLTDNLWYKEKTLLESPILFMTLPLRVLSFDFI